jgi:hypothetical protein
LQLMIRVFESFRRLFALYEDCTWVGRKQLVLAVFRRLSRRVIRPAVLRLGRMPFPLPARFNGLSQAALAFAGAVTRKDAKAPSKFPVPFYQPYKGWPSNPRESRVNAAGFSKTDALLVRHYLRRTTLVHCKLRGKVGDRGLVFED